MWVLGPQIYIVYATTGHTYAMWHHWRAVTSTELYLWYTLVSHRYSEGRLHLHNVIVVYTYT